MRIKNATSWKLAGASALTLGLFTAASSSNATVIAYDGFADGGTADGRIGGATAYTTSPASTNGLNNDSINTQSPISTGFADGDGWTAAGSVASGLYWEAQSGGLTYTDYQPNTSGQARIFSTLGNMSSVRTATRVASTTDTSDVQWVAMLLNFASAPADMLTTDFNVQLQYGPPGDSSAPYDGAWTPANFGVNSDGKAYYETAAGTSKVDVESSSALGAGTHLLLLKFEDRPGASGTDRYDDVTLWVDPVLTANPNDLTGGLSAVSIMRSDLGGTVRAFDRITISAQLTNNNPVIFDEFIIATDYQDIYQVPEPGSLALIGVGGLLIVRRRRG